MVSSLSVTAPPLPFDKEADSSKMVTTAAKNTVREWFPGTWGGIVGDGYGFFIPSQTDLLPAWGTPACDWQLRILDYAQHAALWSGAKQIWKEKFLSTPYEISGGKNLTYQWQDIFFESEFGEGYDALLQPALDDYLTLNRGMFIEKIAYGDPSTPIGDGAKILGLAHLDALRIIFTGNRETPYIYYSEYTSKAHLLHASRVIHLADSPSPNTRMFGVGRSKLYNALTVANMQILLGRYNNELMSDAPPPGLVIFNNINPDQIDNLMTQYEADRRREGQVSYRQIIDLRGLDPDKPATVQFIPLASVPSDFKYDRYMQQHVNLLALVMGLDPQDIWPLTGAALGTGTQSRLLDAKTFNKGPGYFLTRFEREMNQLLPTSLEWKYKAQNAEQDKATADTAKVWTDIVNASTFMSQIEKRQLAANQVPAFADVLMDEQGNVRLPDDDPKEQGQQITANDIADLTTAIQTTTANSDTPIPTETPASEPPNPDTQQLADEQKKAIDDTQSAFTDEIEAIMQDAIDKAITRGVASARLRGAIVRYGKQAYTDGLEDGGVDTEFSDEDTANIADVTASQQEYVNNLVDELYSDKGLKGTPEDRALAWKVTTDTFYYAGIESADRNGMYEFTGDDGKESCSTCQKLQGVKHRMKWWVDNELRPGVDHDNFECGGWQCQHALERV